MLNLFLQRRFQHCLISAAFYRFIFKGSAQKMEVGQKDIAEFLPSSDVPITVDTLEYLARQALTEAKDGMEAVRNDYKANRRLAALERLQESFFLGEFTSEIIRFDAGQRQTLNAIYQKMGEAKGAANAKDYAAVLGHVGDINRLTGDFKSAELVGSVQAVQELSNINVRGAQQASAQGDFDKAGSYVAKAADIWPTNPALREFTQRAATMGEGVTFFDDAYAAGELRRIYTKKEGLAVSLARDSVRLPRLKDALDRMSKLEAALVQSDAMLAQNNPYAAWETLLAVSPLAPEDPVLNQRKAKLAPRVADFVNALDRAERAETAHEPAASLAHFMAAQDLYPASAICHEGLERVSALLLAQLGKDTPSPANK
jgi:tetratricopeptide (TPR) repeat protein